MAVVQGRRGVTLTGNEAAALVMRQVNPDVVAAYPITPQTDIVQYFAGFVADGKVDTQFVTVESEHSAMSACVGAAAAGARAMTATSSQGMAYMFEVVYIAASLRLPIVMAVVNRALSGPINIHCDHSDSMGVRDSGWIQLYSENAQEVYDNLVQAVRIAEDPAVRLPVMVMQDGFQISHALENLEILEDAQVRRFVGEYRPEHNMLSVEHPVTVGAFASPDYYFELRRQQAEAMRRAPEVIRRVAEEYAGISGRRYDFFEAYRMEDAAVAVVVLNSTAGTAKDAVDELREQGVAAGALKLRMFRPFPEEELRRVLGGVRALAVLDRSDGLAGQGGPVYSEVRGALFGLERAPRVVNYVYGLGGREVTLEHIRSVYRDLMGMLEGREQKPVSYLGIRE